MTKRNDRPRRDGRSLGLVGWLAIGCGSVLAMVPSAIPWRSDLRRAEAEARAQDRLLWVQFTGSWCPNCVRLEREAFRHPMVVGHARNFFVPVKLQSEEHEDLVVRFGLTGIPATILVAPTGEVVARHEGYVDPATFHAFLEKALVRSGRSPRQSPSGLTRASAVEPRLALDGFCPISLIEGHRLVSGQRALTLSHNGLLYRFADDRMRQAFRKQPERYLPVNGGRCPVTQVDRGEIRPGAARWSVLYKDHLFLCGDEEGRDRFIKNPDRYAHVAMADRQVCPHCWGRDGLSAQGTTGSSLAPIPSGWRPRPIDPSSLETRRPGSEAIRR
jgi:thioredoxin-related protein/YHS domain-containing protein